MPRSGPPVAGVALLFAAAGAMSSAVFWDRPGWEALVPIPFSAIAVAFSLRPARAIIVVPLYLLVWHAALTVAMDMELSHRMEWGAYLPGCRAV
jgi:hypothetical protein